MINSIGIKDIWIDIRRTGYWFFPVIASWFLIYILNALAFRAIIYEPQYLVSNPSFLTVVRITIVGYAINYITPFVALGGEPYRILELKRYLGVHKATSSVLLYGMMHMFSHIVFWLLSILLMVACLNVDLETLIALIAVFVFGLLVCVWFLRAYKVGFTRATFIYLQRLPFIGKRAGSFAVEKDEALNEIDSQIRVLYGSRKRDFYTSLFLELLARVVTCAEIWFAALALGLKMSVFDALIVSSASSLFANLIFFFPMQLGVREGGLALSLKAIGLPAESGIFIGVVLRIRELVWILIGMILLKLPSSTFFRKKNNSE